MKSIKNGIVSCNLGWFNPSLARFNCWAFAYGSFRWKSIRRKKSNELFLYPDKGLICVKAGFGVRWKKYIIVITERKRKCLARLGGHLCIQLIYIFRPVRFNVQREKPTKLLLFLLKLWFRSCFIQFTILLLWSVTDPFPFLPSLLC